MDLLNKILIQIFTSIFCLTILFKTEAIVEYSKLFKIDKLLKVDKYLIYKNSNPDIDFMTFLLIKYPNFITKLISCPFCINFWIVLGSSILMNNIIYLPVVYISSIVVYLILERKVYG
jgi:hypothetical protein